MLFKFKKYSTFFLLLILLSTAEISAQERAPELGDPYSTVLSLKNEELIGLSSFRRLQKFNYIINDPLISSYINYLGNLLSRNLLDGDRRYTFFVVNSEQINAFAIPGGYIGLNAGLILLTENEAQLASVVAHEISHVKLRHTAEMMANSRRNSIPLWIGIFAGIFSGNPKASVAALQAGIGFSSQKNINLIRSNEVEADTLGLQILEGSEFNTAEMAKLFELMQNAKGDVQKNLAYLSTHPMFEERISNSQNRSSASNNKMINSSQDFSYIKNIIEVSLTLDINQAIKNTKSSDVLSRHKKALLYQKKSGFYESLKILKKDLENEPTNLYIASAYIDGLLGVNKIDEAVNELNYRKKLSPLNKIYPYKLASIYADYGKGSVVLAKSVENHKDFYNLNPNFHRMMSKIYLLENNKYQGSLYLSNYYVLIDNIKMSLDVLSDASKSRLVSKNERKRLLSKRSEILCKYNRPLEPIFGEKTCN